MKFSFSILALFIVFNLSAQQDYQWFKIKKYKVGTLSSELDETSALKFLDGKLYTLNDGGNTSELFEIDKTSGEILNKIKTGLSNFDWEALTADEQHFYIGEFGNNWGIRKDLTIYKMDKDNHQKIDTIKFYYPEQDNFNKQPHRHNFDAESLIYKDENLHLFTKEWQSYQTTHYKINPQIIGEKQAAEKLESYNLGYIATDASYFEKKLYIVGYNKNMEVYMTVFDEDDNGLFFTKKPQKYYLGQTPSLSQIEGIAVNEEGIYISGEAFRYKIFNAKPSFYFIPKKHFK